MIGILKVRAPWDKKYKLKKLDDGRRHRRAGYVRPYGLLIPSRRPVLLEALLAVHRPALRGLEGDLVLFPTVRADDLVHLSGATVVSAAPLSVTHYSHSFSIRMLRTPRGILRTLPTRCASLLLNLCMES